MSRANAPWAAVTIVLVTSCSAPSSPSAEAPAATSPPVISDAASTPHDAAVDAPGPADSRPVDVEPDASTPPPTPEKEWRCHELRRKRGDVDFITRCYRTLFKCLDDVVEANNGGQYARACRPVDQVYCYSVRNDVEEYRYIRCSLTLDHCNRRRDAFWSRETDTVTECVLRE